MQPIQNKRKPGYNGAGIKFLLTSLSVAVTIGFWHLFSSKDSNPFLSTQSKSITAQDAAVEALKLAPLPTLVPIQNNLAGGSPPPAPIGQLPPSSLRQVGIPTAQPSGNGNAKSLFEFVTISGPGGGDEGGVPNGNGGGGTTSTGSSK